LSKIARTLGVLAVATAPFLMFSAAPASATGGCAVNNASTSTSGSWSISLPDGTVSVQSSSLSCSYVSGGGLVHLSCTLAGGVCQAKVGSAIGGTCIGYANTTCAATFNTVAGDTVTLTVYGGSGSVADAV
jgi:hypothetical protein